jgi:hypothetical protein|uniref:hypothetical protein n=1 Tax=Cephaloticoccus sp. TaxID=1985742 RepID=UPI00404A98B9
MNDADQKRKRMKRTIAITCTALIIGAILLLALPINLPLPFRLALAFLDLVAAAVVWLSARQNLKN